MIYSRIGFRNGGPPFVGLDPTSPFGANVIGSANATFANTAVTGLAPEAGFSSAKNDIEVIKTVSLPLDHLLAHPLKPSPLRKRYDATMYNDLLAILTAARIDTVVLSGVRSSCVSSSLRSPLTGRSPQAAPLSSSGVILSTAYTLFDSGFKVYVLKDVTYDAVNATQQAIMAPDGILAKLPANVITLADALQMI